MKAFAITFRAAAVAALFALGACNQTASAPAEAPQDDAMTIAAARSFLDAWATARKGGDGAALSPMYSASASFRWIEDGRVMYTAGADAAAALDFASTGGYTPDLSLGRVDITPLGPDAVAVAGDYTQSLRLGTITVKSPGVFTATLVETDGQWQFLQANFNTAADAPDAAPAASAPAPAGPAAELPDSTPPN